MTTRKLSLVLAILALALSAGASAQQALTFTKSFDPATIGPGGVSTMTFTIVNSSGQPANDVMFSDGFPAGLSVATPANAFHSCGNGDFGAAAGSSAVNLTFAQVGALETCTATVDVTAVAPGVYTNTTSTLASDIGPAPAASADLTVASDRPGFSKSFEPGTVAFGGRSTLTFTIDNSANGSLAANLTFTDGFPPGLEVADPSNASSTCSGGTITALPGAGSVSYAPAFFGDATVGAGASCIFSVDVVGQATGALDNVSGDLTSTTQFSGTPRSSGKASATLAVTADKISLTKSFPDDPTAPGSTAELEFTIFNLSRTSTATNIAFTDDLATVVPGLAASGLPTPACGGTLSGTTLLNFSGGSLPPEGTCTFSVTLDVPAAAPAGGFASSTSAITADIDGMPAEGDRATDTLFIQSVPVLTKEFQADAVGAGDDIVLRFTVTNSSATESATDIAFTDEFTSFLPSPISAVLPGADPCGAGSSVILTSLGVGGEGLSLSGGNLGAGEDCTFDVTLTVPAGVAPGTYTNTTEAITATVAGQTLTGDPASDSFDVVAAPALLKEFIDDPAVPGGTVTLRFTVTYDANGDGVIDFDVPGGATDISFSDDLGAVLTGLAASGLPLADVCGVGSEVVPMTNGLQLNGGVLDAGSLSCSFDVTLAVPGDATPGSYTNTTSNVMATVVGLTTTGNAASDDLRIAGLTLAKEFTDDPVRPGETVTLEFTLENLSPSDSASAISFTDSLDGILGTTPSITGDGVAVNDVCGPGNGSIAWFSANELLSFTNGSLAAGATCSFSVSLSVPASAVPDTYVNRTSNVSATVAGGTVIFDGASDELTIIDEVLALSKQFLDDPVAPGSTVDLEFTLTNLSSAEAVSDVAFTDDLDAVLSGLVATGLPAAACGGTVSGTSVISLSGASLAAGASCSFTVTLQVPGNAPLGTNAINTTSAVTGTVGGSPTTGDPAVDELAITSLVFTKSFNSPVEQWATATLTFTIRNLNTAPASDLTFIDDLNAMGIPGLAATGLPAPACGGTLSGSDVISLSGGSLLPGASCTFSVDLPIALETIPGDYDNVTSELRQGTTIAAAPASATLTVIELLDSDGDGVLNTDDFCPATVIPEGVPTKSLKPNRYALVDADWIFDHGGGGNPLFVTTTDTAGCSCEQIIVEMNLGEGHTKHGCSKGAMEDWISLVAGYTSDMLSTSDGRAQPSSSTAPVAPQTGSDITVAVTGSGDVSSTRREINGQSYRGLVCSGGSTCQAEFEPGALVALFARPVGSDSVFEAWGGDCSGTDPVTTVEVRPGTVCTAVFRTIND